MQTQTTRQHYQGLGRMPGISMIVSCVAAILLTWGPSSIGGTSDIPAPAVLSAILTPVYSANERLPGPAQGSSDGDRSVCAGACTADDLVNAPPVGDPSQERADVATFVEWHVQARHLAQYDYQTIMTVLPRPEGKGDGRPTAVSVAAPLWTTFAR